MSCIALTFLLEKYHCIETGPLQCEWVCQSSPQGTIYLKHLPSLSEIPQEEGGNSVTSVMREKAELWVSKSSVLSGIMTRVPRIKTQTGRKADAHFLFAYI